MAHPFTKMFDRALAKSTVHENKVLEVAEQLFNKGYRAEEIHGVLKKFHAGLIQDEDREIAGEALEEFSRHTAD